MRANRTSNESAGQDYRVTQAHRVLQDTTHGHDTFGEAVGQVLELRHALAGVLSFVAETAPGGELDEIGRTVADLAANRQEISDALRMVRDALAANQDETERLDRIERGVDGLRRAIIGAVKQEMDQK